MTDDPNIGAEDEVNRGEERTIDEDGSYVCDACGEEIVVPLDPAAGQSQQYVEDCPVCCNPNLIHVDWDEEDRPRIWAEPEQDRF